MRVIWENTYLLLKRHLLLLLLSPSLLQQEKEDRTCKTEAVDFLSIYAPYTCTHSAETHGYRAVTSCALFSLHTESLSPEYHVIATRFYPSLLPAVEGVPQQSSPCACATGASHGLCQSLIRPQYHTVLASPPRVTVLHSCVHKCLGLQLR